MIYGLIAEKLGHSFSKDIHSYLADYEYELYEMEEKDVGDFLKNCPLDAFNVTIPYKKTDNEEIIFLYLHIYILKYCV